MSSGTPRPTSLSKTSSIRTATMTDQQHTSIVSAFAARHMVKPETLQAVLLRTIAPEGATDEDIIAFLQIAYRFDLDPWAREIYLIKSKGKIYPYISVDGYARIVNREPQYDNCEFSYEQDAERKIVAVTCTMWRKDRTRPIVVTEFYDECVPPPNDRGQISQAWARSPSRMLRHRAFVQAARLCFGVSGALDEANIDSGEDINGAYSGPTIDLERTAPAAPRKAAKEPPSPKQQQAQQKPAETQQKAAETQQERKPDRGRMFDDDEVKQPNKVADVETFMNELHDRLAEAKDVDQLREIWVDMNPAAKLMPNRDMMDYAQGLYDRTEAKLKAPQ